MKSKYLRCTVAVAALYFSGNLYAQESDTLQKEQKIDEVVVIGYGKAKAKDLTGSVSVINLTKAGNQPVADIGQAIQGRASGVSVINSGEPGSNVTFRIRGTGTIQNNDPLIVVDGMPLNGGLNQINMNDVESINILKDASSTAIYGARGANGVVMITTKRGAKGGILNFDTFTGVQSVTNMTKVLNASQYAQLNNELLANGGQATNPEFANPAALGNGTDWLKALFSPAMMSSYSLSYGDRSEKSNIYVSASYFNQKGVVLNTNYDRYIVQLNGDTKIKPFLKIGNRVKLQHDVKTKGSYDIKNTILSLPTRAIYDANGNFAGPGSNPMLYGDIDNPIGKATIVDNSTKGYNIQGNIYAEIDLIKDLKFKSLGGIEANLWYDRTWSPKYAWGIKTQENSYLYEGSNRSITMLWDNTLTYDKNFGEHHINAVVGTSAQTNQYNYLNASVSKFASDNTQQIDNGILQPVQHGNMSEWALMSYLARATYNYADKYYLTATIRRDGSSRFGVGNKWGWFPSAALAWRISNENFLKDSKTINNLKLRLGYGITGNQNIGNYAFASSYNTYQYNFNNTYVSAVMPTVLPNPYVKWEGQEQYNVGFDLDILNNRISLIVDGYIKNTNDMLVPMSVPVTSGYSDVYTPSINAGKIQNKGIEATLSTKNFVGENFKWSTDVVFSYNKNNAVDINSKTPIITASGGLNSTFAQIMAGYPVNVFYGYVTDGIFQNQAEVDAHAVQMPGSSSTTSTSPGDIRFKDLNNDGVINDKDRTIIGNPNPKFTFSLNNTFTYKNFDLTIFLQGSYGNDILNANRMYTEAMSVIQNQSTAVLGRWTGEGTSYTMPRAVFGDPNQNSRVSNRYVEDGSYIKVKNINLSYTLPKGVFGENLNMVKVFLSAQNLITWTKYSGFDPEVPVNGIDNGTYPITRIVSLGLNIGF